jgi:tRNA threonylcarbamoyladenosine biosynthesis protein TsaE
VPESLNLSLDDASATEALGARLAAALAPIPAAGLTIWLAGELGTGKTTFVRALLRALGHRGRVPSPTYTLVEAYELAAGPAHHVDLYRLRDPAEAAYLGLSELPLPGGLLLVEWPARAVGHLPAADIELVLEISGAGRAVALRAASAAGAATLRKVVNP